MQFGVVFPTRQIGTNPSTVADYAQTAESVGFHHLLTYDHVLGADRGPDWNAPYDYTDEFHEPLTLFAYLAAVTDELRFMTGILILSQRQTVLVAKQAAEVDILSDGRLTVGVGTGWNQIEYSALGREFADRGRRLNEQIELLRELWQRELVSWDGDVEADVSFEDAGLNPLPVQQPIPIWIGGGADVVLQRAARVGDGWMIPGTPPLPGESLSERAEQIRTLKTYLREAGCDPDDFPIRARVRLGPDDPEGWLSIVRKWRRLGVTSIAVDTMEVGIKNPSDHATKIARFAEAVRESNIEAEFE